MSRSPKLSDVLGPQHQKLPSDGQLFLLTSVIGTSPLWLFQSFIQQALTENVPVVLVSFMERYEYYQDWMKKVGIDLNAMINQSQFAFVDGLNSLSSDSESRGTTMPGNMAPRSMPGQRSSMPAIGTKQHNLSFKADSSEEAQQKSFIDCIHHACQSLSSRTKPLIIISNPDLLLATLEHESSLLIESLQSIQALSHCLVLHIQADSVFTQSVDPSNFLENRQTAFVISLAHMAEAVLSLRLLDTGVAKDVSGVMRITNGAVSQGNIEEKERLYFVGDASVKMFRRGESH